MQWILNEVRLLVVKYVQNVPKLKMNLETESENLHTNLFVL